VVLQLISAIATIEAQKVCFPSQLQPPVFLVLLLLLSLLLSGVLLFGFLGFGNKISDVFDPFLALILGLAFMGYNYGRSCRTFTSYIQPMARRPEPSCPILR
jgi:hypothetical protein